MSSDVKSSDVKSSDVMSSDVMSSMSSSIFHSETRPNDDFPTRWWERLLGACVITIFVGTWMCSIVSPILVFLSVYYQYYTTTCILILGISMAYLPFDKKSVLIRDFMRQYHECYYQKLSIDFEQDPSSNPKTFYAVHPHGIYCMGWSILFLHPLMEKVKFCFSPVLYTSPFFRLLTEITGNPGSADKSSLMKFMMSSSTSDTSTKNNMKNSSVALPPGGFEEATISSTTQDRVFIKKRTGFIKLCLKYGYSVSPVYVFGENELFYNAQGLWGTRFKLNRFGFPAILPFGNIFLPFLLPRYKKSLHIVVGKPLSLPHIPNPTLEQIQHHHQQYQTALQNLFKTHAPRFTSTITGSKQLEIW